MADGRQANLAVLAARAREGPLLFRVDTRLAPAAGPGGATVLAGSDVLIGGGDGRPEGWVLTLRTPLELLRSKGGTQVAGVDGPPVRVSRDELLVLAPDTDREVLTWSWAGTVDVAEVRVAGVAVRPGELQVVCEHGLPPSPAACAVLAAVSDACRESGLERGSVRFDDGWSVDRLAAALSAWLRAHTGVEAVFRFDAEAGGTFPLLELVADRVAASEVREAELARLPADGPGGFPAGQRWLSHPVCGWEQLPDVPLVGELPERCSLPSVAVWVGPPPDVRPAAVSQVEGDGRFPSGAAVCARHAEQLAELAVADEALVWAPGFAPR